MKVWPLFFSFLSLFNLHAEVVEIISNMYTEEILQEACFYKIKDSYEIRITDQRHQSPITTQFDEIKRFIIFNGHDNLAILDDCLSEKKVLFLMEPSRVFPEDVQTFSRVYTWDDDAIDGEKFFKYYFPDLLPMQDPLLSFEDRKLCTMIVRNWHANHRGPIIKFFSSKPKNEFDFYGSPYPELIYNKQYKGRIPGKNCGEEKISVLNQYKFCMCFENHTTMRGYLTEKIFPCFAAGCIPIYWGAPNVEEYIPKDCFIDYRDFESNEELYQFLKKMPKEVYENYLDAIRAFLNSEQAQLFSPEYFAQILYEAATQ